MCLKKRNLGLKFMILQESWHTTKNNKMAIKTESKSTTNECLKTNKLLHPLKKKICRE